MNEFKPGTINHACLDTECGINRVLIRSISAAGVITLSAKRDGAGIKSSSVRLESKPVNIKDSLIRIKS